MNSELLKGILLFLSGGAAGCLVTGFVCKRKIDKLEEINNELEEKIDERVVEGIEEYCKMREEENKRKEEINGSDQEDNDSDLEKDEEFSEEIMHSIKSAADRARTKPDPMQMAKNIMEKEHYINYSHTPEEPVKNDVPEEDFGPMESMEEEIEIIAPQDVGDIPSYGKVELYYLRDESLVDDEGNPVENIHECIGDDALNEIGVYEPDAVFVRNNRQQIDYSIFLMRDKTLANFSL